MEVIRIPGYTEDEKVNISQKYLIPNKVKIMDLNLTNGTLMKK